MPYGHALRAFVRQHACADAHETARAPHASAATSPIDGQTSTAMRQTTIARVARRKLRDRIGCGVSTCSSAYGRDPRRVKRLGSAPDALKLEPGSWEVAAVSCSNQII